jgi:Ras-related protein Rab-8A
MDYDVQLRLLLLGNAGAGKSSLLVRFTDDVFVPQTSTVGVDFRTKIVTMMWLRVRLQLWDTNGQERFRSITRAYYRGAQGVALVFDTCDRQSFANVSRWVADIREHTNGTSVVVVVCANKVDLAACRVVSTAEGRALASEMGCEYFETSAKTGAGVDAAFISMAEHVLCGGPRSLRLELLSARQRLLWCVPATTLSSHGAAMPQLRRLESCSGHEPRRRCTWAPCCRPR